jgi:predicted secreted protein
MLERSSSKLSLQAKPFRPRLNTHLIGRVLLILLVVTPIALVHGLQVAAAESAQAPKLPAHVSDLREAILTAARSGNIDELKSVFEMSGRAPDIGAPGATDPIAALKTQSADGKGQEILANLIELLNMPPAAKPFGSDIENNLLYIWPYLAERPLDKLTPAEEVDLYRLVSPAKAAEMHEKKRWMWWCVVIAADGNWLMFKRIE